MRFPVKPRPFDSDSTHPASAARSIGSAPISGPVQYGKELRPAVAIAPLLIWFVLWLACLLPWKNGLAETPAANEPARPLPERGPLPDERSGLGRILFHDVRLSADDSISCASCHDLATGGVDLAPHSTGIDGQEGSLNAPTVYNSGLCFRLFWDGRAATLEEQAAGPVHNPLEMGSNWAQVLEKLGDDAELTARFTAIYPDGLQSQNIQDAIAAFERTLQTPSRFDRYLRGDANAITDREKRGWRLFKSRGCIACHQGINIGCNLFQKLGVFGDYFVDHDQTGPEDQGRYNVTGLEEDRHRFKVPTLRNVALTPPYFHDGHVETLEEAVILMARYQLGHQITETETGLILDFLRSLNGVLFESTPSSAPGPP